MTYHNSAAISRAISGFAIGLLVCFAYWLTGTIPREMWFSYQGTDIFIKSKYWFWPGSVLDVVFRELHPLLAAIALYAINGLTYLAISLALFLSRRRVWANAFVALLVCALLTWFNASVMQTFSWIWFAVVVFILIFVSYLDIRSQGTTVSRSGRH